MVPNGTGVDRSPNVIGYAAQANGEALPFANETFETAVLCGVLEQCANWQYVLAEALRVTSGWVIGTVPYPGTKFTRWTEAEIPETSFPHTERINDSHFYFEVQK